MLNVELLRRPREDFDRIEPQRGSLLTAAGQVVPENKRTAQSLGEERDGDGGLHACAMLTSPAALRSNEDEECLSARFHCGRPQLTGKTITGIKNQPSAILSSQQDGRQKEESGFYAVSLPLPATKEWGEGNSR